MFNMNKKIIKFCGIIDDYVTIEIKYISDRIQTLGMNSAVKIPGGYSCDCPKISECKICIIGKNEFEKLRKQDYVLLD